MKKDLKRNRPVLARILCLLMGSALLLSSCGGQPAGEKTEAVHLAALLPAESVWEAEEPAFSEAGPAATVQGRYDEETHRFQAVLQSHTENIKKYYERAGMDVIEVSVAGGRVGLRAAEDSDRSHIECVYYGEETDFSELLGRQVSLDFHKSGSDYAAAFALSPWETTGASEISFPMIFQLIKGSVDKERIAENYQFYGQIRYKVTARTPQKGCTSFFVQPEEVFENVGLPM